MAAEHIRDVLQRIPAILAGMYESPAEECLGERLRTLVNPETIFQTQVWVGTRVGRFRLDILLTGGEGKRQQAARKHDAEFAHELFPCGWLLGLLQSGSLADPKPRIAVWGSACWPMLARMPMLPALRSRAIS